MKKTLTLVILFSALTLFPFGKNKITYDTFEWQIYSTQHFDLYHYSAEADALPKIASMAETAYETLARKFNYRMEKKVPLIFYRTHAEFEQTNVLLNFIPEGVGAFAEPIRNRMVLPIDLPDDKLQKLILHELTHIFQFVYFFQGSVGKNIFNQPPQWFVEGMASYMADDEDAFAKMVLRDAAVNDRIPSITTRGIGGYFAYRFGHAAFNFIEDTWGEEGLRSFFYEYRSNISRSMEKSIRRAFDIAPEEFDMKFRTYLRKKYLPVLIDTGEPHEFGKPFLTRERHLIQLLSPSFSPSGDLIVAVGNPKQDVDVILLSADGKEIIKNLTPGYVNDYEYMIASFLTVGPELGKDVAFSNSGNEVAFFVRRGKGRELVILDLFTRKQRRISFDNLAQERSPAFSPDGKKIVFDAWGEVSSNIFQYDIESETLTNLTNDSAFSAAPAFSPDGKTLVFSQEIGIDIQLFTMDLENPQSRKQITFSPGRHISPQFDPSGEWIYYAWDPDDILNIYRMEIATGKVEQLTNAVSGCFSPAIHKTAKGKPYLIFTGYFQGQFELFYQEDPEVIRTLEEVAPEEETRAEPYKPLIEVPVDPEAVEKSPKFKLQFEDASVQVGVNTDQRFMTYSYIRLSDMLGNRHLWINMESVSTYTNTSVSYYNLKKRLQWGLTAYDYRTYYLTYNYYADQGRDYDRERFQRYTGATAFFQYPFNFTHRGTFGLGYMSRSIEYPVFSQDQFGNYTYTTYDYADDFAYLSTSFNGDSTVWQSFGPYAGRRYQLAYTVAPQMSGTPKTYNLEIDFRQYIPFGRRSLIAYRLVGARSGGEQPGIYTFGGLDTLRGFDFREFFGTNMVYSNLEVRFPIIDILRFPFMELRGIRGRVFLDMGGAWFDDEPFQFIQDGRMKDGVASYGFGFSAQLLGLDWHWDFARKWDLKESLSGTETSFWIGRSF
ncbi:MAG TPA: hypothetical protein PK014_11225 [Thermoanaerobaculia bacterium]|nr:hypothetical protein [Thermoanaerobaculia bacterium]HUM30694.1 hypothetical protein [Thermoanaerobaculia bacterium]HXK68898.1 hypothetical protein [Thermoanaerobaculia bacterium]